MLFVDRLFQRMMGHAFNRGARRRREFSPFGIVAAQVQVLESRRLLSALTVTTAADSGAGSLRAEIAAANNGDTINFADILKGQTITLTSGELLINKGLTIQGPGAGYLSISGGNASRVFDVTSSQPVVLTGLTIMHGSTANSMLGSTANSGGAISDAVGTTLTISDCLIFYNHALAVGGDIYNLGTLTVNRCLFGAANAFEGGDVYNAGSLTLNQSTVASGRAQYGGGIYNTGTLTANACAVINNAANGWGGGIFVAAGQSNLTNCTIAQNHAVRTSGLNVGNFGGGLYVGGSSHVSLTNCTVADNVAQQYGGIAIGHPHSSDVPTVALVNTIVAGNTGFFFLGTWGSPYSETTTGADIWGSVALADHNLIGYGAGCNIVNGVNGNIVGGNGFGVINAGLGSLQHNGGPTMTMALSAGSPAIGHADNALAPATDQRGVTRFDVTGELTDIGAYEV